jgi:hypothetical protein
VNSTRKPDLHARAARNNMGVVRFFGFPAMRGFNLQTRPGQYTEQAFVGIDRVIAAAADHGCALPCRAFPGCGGRYTRHSPCVGRACGIHLSCRGSCHPACVHTWCAGA